MMGRQSKGQNQLFYSFCLEDHVPATHQLRRIDRFLDLGGLHEHLAPHYSSTGRPSVDPELLMRMLIVGYCFGIRSERRLCEEVHLNLAYRWFCRLGLEDAVPDHSTFSKNRHGRFRDSDTLRFVFESVLSRCIAEGLVGGEGFAVDASVIRADAGRQRGGLPSQEVDWAKAGITRPVREYLDALDGPDCKNNVSLTDPAAQWTCSPGGPAYYAYSTNYLADTKAGIVVDVEATTALRAKETESTKVMVERVEQRFGTKPQRLIGDMAYGTAGLLAWMINEKQIEPHVPVLDKTQRTDGTMSRWDFQWDAAANEYRCPSGNRLTTTGQVTAEATLIYRSKNVECASCALKPRCCPNTPNRKITRSIHEEARDAARALADTPAYRQSRKDRKKVEMLFAHLKRILKLDRLRLRGLTGAHDEFLMAATAQNLRRMALWLGQGPPDLVAAPLH